ncbi:MAG: alanine:cation symporter family protein [Candidatus Marinimicrobia bacterium]|nr:alanine:cation symporter family protein [Candidatus Neomarinimicrobiota bacterium]
MSFAELIASVQQFVWGPVLMILLVGTGLFLTVRYKFVQIRGFKHGAGILSGKYDRERDPGEITHFQALMAALSATVGTGNIVGVATAILTGGPGALFWMWITALVGMATKFSSCTLAVRFRRVDDKGVSHGGPMHYIEHGMGKNFKWLAVMYALFTMFASFGIGNMFQINNIATSLNFLVNGDKAPTFLFNIVTGVVVAVLVGAVILGGIKSIGKVAAKIVPFMCVFYIGAGLIIIFKNFNMIPEAFREIFYYAFHTPEALAGGLLGTVVRNGVARGLFSNEAGLGSAAIAHGAAKTKEPVREGLVAMLEPFIDTIMICTITGLIIVMTGAHEIFSDKGELTSRAFEIGLNSALGGKIVAFGIVLFAFSTLISWSYYGDRASDYLFGERAVVPYRWIYLGFLIFGAVIQLDVVIGFSDIMNAMMALPNLIALIVLSPFVAAISKDYFKRMKAEKAEKRKERSAVE